MNQREAAEKKARNQVNNLRKCKEAYQAAQKKIAELQAELTANLKPHEDSFCTGLMGYQADWGMVGDLQRIAADLENIASYTRVEDE